MMNDGFRTGFVAVVGRPNVGKSTLVNRLVGQKVTITSAKAQTTRHAVRGILTREDAQFVFVDTPGFQTRHGNALSRLMNRSVKQTLAEVDVVLLVLEAGRYGETDRRIVELLPQRRPQVAVVSKIDRMARRELLLPFMAKLAQAHAFADIVPIAAEKGDGLKELLAVIARHLPVAPPLFDAEDITDRSERFLAAEFLREKLFRRLGEELPYGLAVEIERFEQEGALRRIHAAVLVDKETHKAIVIGGGGGQLKRIAADARVEMERLFGGKVYLEVWVKVRSGWADDERALRSLGYE